MPTELFNLNKETAIVTGGSGYLGYAIAEALSEHEATVVIAGRNIDKCNAAAEKIRSKTGNFTFALELDISSGKSINDAFTVIDRELKGFNILINNASYSFANSLEEMTDQEWQAGLEGTVTGVFKCIREAVPHLRKSNISNLSIVNIASMYGMVSPDPNIYGDSGFNNPPNYGAGKAAIIQLTKYAACHLAGYGIRVNSISPGPFPKPEVQINELFIRKLKEKNPLNRIGQPREIKGAAVFLASAASSYVTGQNIAVDGGWTAW